MIHQIIQSTTYIICAVLSLVLGAIAIRKAIPIRSRRSMLERQVDRLEESHDELYRKYIDLDIRHEKLKKTLLKKFAKKRAKAA